MTVSLLNFVQQFNSSTARQDLRNSTILTTAGLQLLGCRYSIDTSISVMSVAPITQNVTTAFDPSYHDPHFMTESKIQNANGAERKIAHRVKFFKHCCYFCEKGAARRKYIYIFENGFQSNYPTAFMCIPPNVCCPGADAISTTYFDRGLWDTQSLHWQIGCYKGSPKMVPHLVSADNKQLY